MTWTRVRPAFLALVLMVTLCLAYFLIRSLTRTPFEKQLALKREIWEWKKPRQYRYTLKVGCYCALSTETPVVIEVTEGTSKIIQTNGYFNAPDFAGIDSIDSLFDVIADSNGEESEISNVVYDSTYGYPVHIKYNTNIPDGGRDYTVSNFEVLSPHP